MIHDSPQAPNKQAKDIAARFTAQWEAGNRPQLMEFASTISGPARSKILRELISIDVDYRMRTGEKPSVDDYRDHFPELSPDELEELTTRSLSRPNGIMAQEADLAEVSFDRSKPRSILNRFEKIEEIGRGGMGSVWRAKQLSTGRVVALKELLARDLGSAAARRKFKDEVHWASQLQHPNIARVYDSGLLEGSYYYAMELIHGELLDEYAKNNNWTIRQMLETMLVIAGTVQYAHERNILHLDLKPSNILVDSLGKPIIVDFGLARLVRNVEIEKEPQRGKVVGTPIFMAPEQVMGREDRIGRPTDVYSLGVIIYRFVTGEFPRKPNRSLNLWQQQVQKERVRPAIEKNRDIGKDLNAVIMKSLASDPAQRYSDAQQLQADIDNLLQGMEVTVRPLNGIRKAWSWCCRPKRLLQAGNFTITLGAIFAPFHIFAISLGVARFLGASIPVYDHLRLREFIPLMAGFLLFDLYMIYSGLMVRRNRAWALWLNMVSVLTWFSWFVLVLLGVVEFDTGGAVSNMAERFPLYIVFIGVATVGLIATFLGIAAHHARTYLDKPLWTEPNP